MLFWIKSSCILSNLNLINFQHFNLVLMVYHFYSKIKFDIFRSFICLFILVKFSNNFKINIISMLIIAPTKLVNNCFTLLSKILAWWIDCKRHSLRAVCLQSSRSWKNSSWLQKEVGQQFFCICMKVVSVIYLTVRLI